MNKEKKQLVVVGALILMILCVGAFQMMQSSAPPPAPAEAKKEVVKDEKAKEDAKPEVKNPDFANPLARRDPFMKSKFAFAVQPEEPKSKQEPKSDQKLKPIPNPLGSKGSRPWEPPVSGIKPLEVPEPTFGYSLIGIISGANPGAVFADSSGNQKLVEVGQGIDGDSSLIAVSRDKVRVKFHAKTLVLSVGGNASAK